MCLCSRADVLSNKVFNRIMVYCPYLYTDNASRRHSSAACTRLVHSATNQRPPRSETLSRELPGLPGSLFQQGRTFVEQIVKNGKQKHRLRERTKMVERTAQHGIDLMSETKGDTEKAAAEKKDVVTELITYRYTVFRKKHPLSCITLRKSNHSG